MHVNRTPQAALLAIACLIGPAGGVRAMESAPAPDGRSAVATASRVFGPLAAPTGAAAWAEGAWVVTEWSADRVTRVDRRGGRVPVARVPAPSGIVVAADGAILVASYSRGVVFRIAGGGSAEAAPTAFVAGLRTPAGLSLEPDGRLLIADRGLGQVLRREADGTLSVLARDLGTPVQAVRMRRGTLVVADLAGRVVEVDAEGRQRLLTDRIGAPAVGMLVDGDDAVLVPDYRGSAVWRVTREGDARPVWQGLPTPVAMARSLDGSRLAVGTWGDGSLHVIDTGAAR